MPDVRSPELEAEAGRQARLVARAPDEAEVMAFIDAAADWPDPECSAAIS